MVVQITGGKPKGYRPAARSFSDDELRKIAPEIIHRQADGIITGRDLAISLNEDAVARPGEGCWNATLVYLLIRRGKALGLSFVLRDRSTAASLRRVFRRSKDVIAAERSAELIKLVNKVAKTVTCSPKLLQS